MLAVPAFALPDEALLLAIVFSKALMLPWWCWPAGVAGVTELVEAADAGFAIVRLLADPEAELADEAEIAWDNDSCGIAPVAAEILDMDMLNLQWPFRFFRCP